MKKIEWPYRLALVALLMIIMCPAWAFAQTAAGTLAQQQVDQVLSSYQTTISGWYAVMSADGTALFVAVATIQFVWGAVQLLFGSSDFGSWTAFLIRQCFLVGLSYGILENFNTWGGDVVNGLREAAGQAAGTSTISPGNMVIIGYNFMTTVLGNLHFGGPATVATDFGWVLSGIITVIVFALIAAEMALVLVESYFALNAGVILVGLLPASFSNSYAMNAIRWVIATGLKLMVMELIVGVGESIIQGFESTNASQSGASIFVIVASALILLVLVKKIPDYAAALASGHNGGSGAGLVAAAGALAAGVGGAVASSSGIGMAVKEAMAAAGDAGAVSPAGVGSSGAESSASGGGGQSGGSRSLSGRLAGASKILGAQVAKDFGARLSGAPGATSGTMGGRMAMRIRSDNPGTAGKPPLTPDP